MNTESVDEALEAAENALRDFIQEVLENKFGREWLENCGVDEKRRQQWEVYRDQEKQKDVSGIVEDRILYYSSFGDLRRILNKNWDLFKDCFGDQNKIDFYLKELEAFRDTDAHRRELLTHQKQLVLGYCGTIRTAITVFRSKQTPEGGYFPKIEYAKDSFGNISKGSFWDKKHILRPGDEVEFVVQAWDPLNEPLQYRYIISDSILGFGPGNSGPLRTDWGDSNSAVWKVNPCDIATSRSIWICIRSLRNYHASGEFDDSVTFTYKVLPQEPPSKKA